MKNWTTKEAKLAVEWARTPAEERPLIGELANRLGRTPAAVQEFLRRLPRALVRRLRNTYNAIRSMMIARRKQNGRRLPCLR